MVAKLRRTAVGAVTDRQPARWRRITATVILATISGIGAILIGAALWIRRTFGPISIDQMLMHLPGAGGAETTGAETGYISSFVWQALVLPLAIVAVVFVVAAIARRQRGPRKHYAVAPKRTKLRRRLENTARKVRLRRWAPALVSTATLVVGAAIFVQAVSLPQFIRSITTELTMEEFYVVPDLGGEQVVVADGDPSVKKNLVMIFLESIENPLSDEVLFERNLLAPIQEATADWASVSKLQQYEGGGWTMAGLVGTQCGVPLRGAGVGADDINSNEIGAELDSYLPGATCIGDVLSDAGYTNVFMGGAPAQFASKENFLRTHGFDDVKDARYWEDQGETEFSVWGLSDRVLLERAKAEVTQLHESGQPFNLTLLTLDSHEPAHLFDYCPMTTSNDLSSAFYCSMEQVAGFVTYLKEMGYLEDTVVVITGDHRKMIAEGGNFWDQLAEHPDRTIFNRIWSPDGVEIVRDDADQLSMFATMLDLLGLGRADHRAGIGVSTLSDTSDGQSMLDLSTEEYAEMVQSRSAELYSRLWNTARTDTTEAHG